LHFELKPICASAAIVRTCVARGFHVPAEHDAVREFVLNCKFWILN